MTDIALLGTGLLGAGFVESLLAKGRAVRVWNRTAAKTEPLVRKGAVAAADPAAAVRGASHVHLVLSEDDAVDAVITALRPGLGEGVPVIDHTTNLPARVAERYARLRAEGVHYVPAPVFMSPQNAREASGLMVFAGTASDPLQAHLAAMTGKLIHAGERPDLAAVLKLAGNSVYFAMTAAMNDVLAIGRGSGVDDATMVGLFETWKVGLALPFIGQRLAKAASEPPSFELTMARKDARLMQAAAGEQRLIALPAVIAAMDAAIANGHGDRDFVAFANAQ